MPRLVDILFVDFFLVVVCSGFFVSLSLSPPVELLLCDSFWFGRFGFIAAIYARFGWETNQTLCRRSYWRLIFRVSRSLFLSFCMCVCVFVCVCVGHLARPVDSGAAPTCRGAGRNAKTVPAADATTRELAGQYRPDLGSGCTPQRSVAAAGNGRALRFVLWFPRFRFLSLGFVFVRRSTDHKNKTKEKLGDWCETVFFFCLVHRRFRRHGFSEGATDPATTRVNSTQRAFFLYPQLVT